MRYKTVRSYLALAFAASSLQMPLQGQAPDCHGLWVGEVVLGEVNEVTVPLDENNIPRAPDPSRVSPTSDAANLRLILHVDAAGRVRLLKHVAILAHKAGVQETESDVALVTDERLYGVFPPQPATRISSVAFDFGDPKATAAINEVTQRAAGAAADAAALSGATVESVAIAARLAAQPVIAEADASEAFFRFRQQNLNAGIVRNIVNGVPGTAETARLAATALRNGSFYQDTRGLEMIDAIEAALALLPTGATQAGREQLALNTAAAFAEPAPNYDRFLAGEAVGDAITAAARSAAATADGIELKPITSFGEAEGGSAVAVVSPGHGLVSGGEVAIQAAAVSAYNGLQTVVRIDDNSFRIPVAHVAGGAITGYSAAVQAAPLRVTSPTHGLADNVVITIRDSLAGYNGRHVVTVIDADTFTVDVPFDSDPLNGRGVWFARSEEITGYVSSPDGSPPVKVLAPAHGLDNGTIIEILGSGSAAYNGMRSITRIDADSFSIDQAFAGDPADKGRWELPVPIAGFAPPPVLDTLVEAPAHGLQSGDRVVISVAGNPPYNAEFSISLIDADAFTIPVPFDTVSGNPAEKGSWQPAAGGEWRPTAPIHAALNTVAEVVQARAAAIGIQVAAYNDTRATDALDIIFASIIEAAATAENSLVAQMTVLADQAGRDALRSLVPRYPGAPSGPSIDYDDFVRSAEFAGSVTTAANAAATGAMEEKKELLATPDSIRDSALTAAINALSPVYAYACRSLLPELPLSGEFGPGGSGLSVTIVLPANHPTNPFRHRRHPDHTTGIDITRLLSLTFDGADSRPAGRAGYGTDRISGSYEEEIFGLHKPLGPARDIGLRVRGRFELHRISLIDTLNGL
jgi:hypothetical protein